MPPLLSFCDYGALSLYSIGLFGQATNVGGGLEGNITVKLDVHACVVAVAIETRWRGCSIVRPPTAVTSYGSNRAVGYAVLVVGTCVGTGQEIRGSGVTKSPLLMRHSDRRFNVFSVGAGPRC